MSLFKQTKASIQSLYYRVRELIAPSSLVDAYQIPIIINNYNRLSTLKQLIESLTIRGYSNIYILDNCSTYPPLLAYYESSPYEVIRLKANLGFKALWKDKAVRKRFCNDYYILTDSDVVLTEACPTDVIHYLHRLLKAEYKGAFKIGLSLAIDDIPNCYALKQQVITWESRYYQHKNADELYKAPVDTTLAIYRPRVGLSRSRFVEAYRTAYPYQLKHLPWYNDSDNLTEEETYYIKSCKQITAWSSKTTV